MGVIISRFKKQKSTKERLQSLTKDIKSIEEFRQYTQKRQRDIVGRFVLFSVLIFISAAVAFYFWALPERTVDRVLYTIPFVFTPFLIVFLKRIITWYYNRKLRHNEDRLSKLKEEKKKLLEDVMDKETYKTAKEILEQFAPEQLRSKESMISAVPRPVEGRPAIGGGHTAGALVPAGQQDVRRRIMAPPQQQAAPPTPGWRGVPPPATPMTPFQQQRIGMPPGPPMPRPVLPRERGMMDRLVEFIVGDGPSNRYALVCRQCFSHNGMAMQEEFEYLAYRCCYCFAWNPARKQRPQAPRLPMPGGSQDEESASSETDGEEGQVKARDEQTEDEPQQSSEAGEAVSDKSADEDGQPPEEQPSEGSASVEKAEKAAASAESEDQAAARPEAEKEAETTDS